MMTHKSINKYVLSKREIEHIIKEYLKLDTTDEIEISTTQDSQYGTMFTNLIIETEKDLTEQLENEFSQFCPI